MQTLDVFDLCFYKGHCFCTHPLWFHLGILDLGISVVVASPVITAPLGAVVGVADQFAAAIGSNCQSTGAVHMLTAAAICSNW